MPSNAYNNLLASVFQQLFSLLSHILHAPFLMSLCAVRDQAIISPLTQIIYFGKEEKMYGTKEITLHYILKNSSVLK